MRSLRAPGAPGRRAAGEMLFELRRCFQACAAECELIEVTLPAESSHGEAEGLNGVIISQLTLE